MSGCANQYPNSYDIGNIAVLSVTFTNKDGAPLDPTTVILRVKDTNGNVEVYTPDRVSAGVYSYDLTLTLGGTYLYRFEGDGAVVGADDKSLICNSSPVLSS